MSQSNNNQTPFDERLDPAEQVHEPSTVYVTVKDNARANKTFWLWLGSPWQLPRATQFGLAAATGALTVVVLSLLITFFVRRPHATSIQLSQPVPALSAPPATAALPNVKAEVKPPAGPGYDVVASVDQYRAPEPVTEEDRQRVAAQREEDRIIKEKRVLEDKKRAIERQLEDKQLEELRRQEDQKRLDERIAQDKKAIEERQQAEKAKIDEEQRKLDEEQRKLAEVH